MPRQTTAAHLLGAQQGPPGQRVEDRLEKLGGQRRQGRGHGRGGRQGSRGTRFVLSVVASIGPIHLRLALRLGAKTRMLKQLRGLPHHAMNEDLALYRLPKKPRSVFQPAFLTSPRHARPSQNRRIHLP